MSTAHPDIMALETRLAVEAGDADAARKALEEWLVAEADSGAAQRQLTATYRQLTDAFMTFARQAGYQDVRNMADNMFTLTAGDAGTYNVTIQRAAVRRRPQ